MVMTIKIKAMSNELIKEKLDGIVLKLQREIFHYCNKGGADSQGRINGAALAIEEINSAFETNYQADAYHLGNIGYATLKPLTAEINLGLGNVIKYYTNHTSAPESPFINWAEYNKNGKKTGFANTIGWEADKEEELILADYRKMREKTPTFN